MEQKLSSEMSESDIDRKEFSELKKQIKNAEWELCLNIIDKGLDQFDDFTEKQQQTFLKLAVDKLGLGEWKELKKKPTKELLNLIKSEINNGDKDRKIKQMVNEMYNKLKEHSSINSIQERNTDTQETVDEKEVEKVYNTTIQKLKKVFPELPKLQSNPHETTLHSITFTPEMKWYRELTLQDRNIMINDPNGPIIFLDNIWWKWEIHGTKIDYQQKASLDIFQQYINQIIENKDIYTITDDILSFDPSKTGAPIHPLGRTKVLKKWYSNNKI